MFQPQLRSPSSPQQVGSHGVVNVNMANTTQQPSQPSAADRQGEQRPAGAAAELSAVRALVEPLARSHGVELVDVEWASGPQGRILRVTIERDDGGDLAPMAAGVSPQAAGSGVTLDDCVQVSRDISTALDIEDVVRSSAYSLEVSSPGLDRPLRSRRDFHRHRGLLAKVKLLQPAADGQRVLRGTIVSCEEQLLLSVDGKEHTVALDDIAQARLVYVPQKGIKRGGNKRGAAGKRKGNKRRKR